MKRAGRRAKQMKNSGVAVLEGTSNVGSFWGQII